MKIDVVAGLVGLLLFCSATGTTAVTAPLETGEGAGAPVLLGSDGQALPFDSEQQLLSYLQTAQPVTSKTLSHGITKAEKILLEQDGVVAHVVFHDIHSTELRTKRLPNGNIVLFVRDSYTSQIAAYEMSRMLGIDNIPPTVERKFESARGSAQLWIENAMTELDRVENGLQPPDHNLWQQRYADMRIFDNLINNIDRNQGNLLIDPSGSLWMIDHTRSFGRDRALPRPELITRCSRRLWNRIVELDADEVQTRLSPYLKKAEIKAIFVRREKLINLMKKKIEADGVDRVLFEIGAPDPGVEIRVGGVVSNSGE